MFPQHAARPPAPGPNLLIRKSQYLQAHGAGTHINPLLPPPTTTLSFCEFFARSQPNKGLCLLRLSQVRLAGCESLIKAIVNDAESAVEIKALLLPSSIISHCDLRRDDKDNSARRSAELIFHRRAASSPLRYFFIRAVFGSPLCCGAPDASVTSIWSCRFGLMSLTFGLGQEVHVLQAEFY